MTFSSSIFLLYFLPVFLVVYHSVGHRLKNYVLLAASLFFYAWGAPVFVFILLFSASVNYYIIQLLHQQEHLYRRRRWLIVSICINLGLLGYFKYANFFVENVNVFLESLGVQSVQWTAVALPIGISFFTFQSITYSVDVYRRTSLPASSLPNYLLYILSFPQMIAGPIVQYNAVAAEIECRTETTDKRLAGFYRFAIGLAKKVLVANAMALQANAVFDAPPEVLPANAAWIGIIAYTFQIYFDFSGYSDMAIGLGRMIGFTFPENFNAPYISKNITEFWRRWHMTLGNFMRDYLYIPLGGNRVSKKARVYLNLGVVFLLSGLWHGASWTFVVWGVYHGVFLILDRIFLARFLAALGTIPAVAVTFFITMIGWVIFRVESLPDAIQYISALFSFGEQWELNLRPAFVVMLVVAAFFSFFQLLPVGKKAGDFFFNRIQYSNAQHLMLTVFTIVILIACVGSISASGFNPFIYFRF